MPVKLFGEKSLKLKDIEIDETRGNGFPLGKNKNTCKKMKTKLPWKLIAWLIYFYSNHMQSNVVKKQVPWNVLKTLEYWKYG